MGLDVGTTVASFSPGTGKRRKKVKVDVAASLTVASGFQCIVPPRAWTFRFGAFIRDPLRGPTANVEFHF